MFGIPINEPANVFYDNKSVITKSTMHTSSLKKKYNSIAYHHVRKVIAVNILWIAKGHTKENLADFLTKPLGASNLKALIQMFMAIGKLIPFMKTLPRTHGLVLHACGPVSIVRTYHVMQCKPENSFLRESM